MIKNHIYHNDDYVDKDLLCISTMREKQTSEHGLLSIVPHL